MLIYSIAIVELSLHKAVTIDIMTELKKKHFKPWIWCKLQYDGMLTHSFDRFYVVAKYEIPKV